MRWFQKLKRLLEKFLQKSLQKDRGVFPVNLVWWKSFLLSFCFISNFTPKEILPMEIVIFQNKTSDIILNLKTHKQRSDGMCIFESPSMCFLRFFTIQNWAKICLFSKKVKGFTFMTNLLTSTLKTGALCVAFARVKFIIWGCRLEKKIIDLWWWIKKKMACVFLEAHQCVFSDFSPSKIWQNFACFQKKVKGFTFMMNLLTSKLKTGALCVAFARVKFYHLGLPTG